MNSIKNYREVLSKTENELKEIISQIWGEASNTINKKMDGDFSEILLKL